MKVFISKFVRLYGVFLFQNKHICLAIYDPQCESLMSHLQVRMNEAEMLYFRSKLPDPARVTNSEHLGNVFVSVLAYKIKCTCFENDFCPSLSAKSCKNWTYRNAWLLEKLQLFFVDVTIIVLTWQIYTLEPSNPVLKLVCFKDL